MAPISKELETAMNAQAGREVANAHLYRNAEGSLRKVGLEGLAKIMHSQADGEYGHSRMFSDFIAERNGLAEIGEIPSQPFKAKTPIEALEVAYKREMETTVEIYKLYDMAVKEKDYGSQEWLDALAKEQVEEERTTWELLAHLKLIGDNMSSLALYDKELQ
jgi:ferritin